MTSRLPSGSTFGWSKARIKEALLEVRVLIMSQGRTATEANQLIADNVGVGLNTVQGWYSDGDNTRKLPTWEKVDILRYRTGLATPEPLKLARRDR